MELMELPATFLESLTKASGASAPRHQTPQCLEDGTLEALLEDRVFGRYVTSLGYATPEQVLECLRLQCRMLERGGRQMRLPELLVARNYLTQGQTRRLAREFARFTGITWAAPSSGPARDVPAAP